MTLHDTRTGDGPFITDGSGRWQEPVDTPRYVQVTLTPEQIDRALPMPDSPPPETRVEIGGRKDDSGKLRWDLLPVVPLEQVVRVYTIGAAKYNDRNWEKGIKWCRVFAAMMRHGWKWFAGESYDPEDGQHHLASVVWCALALMQYEITKQDFDDRPCSKGGQDASIPERPDR